MPVTAHHQRARDNATRRMHDRIRIDRITGVTQGTTPPYNPTETLTTVYDGPTTVSAIGANPRYARTLGEDAVAESEIRFRLPLNTDVKAGDLVTYTGDNLPLLLEDGERLEVLGTEVGSGWSTMFVWCKRREPNDRR